MATSWATTPTGRPEDEAGDDEAEEDQDSPDSAGDEQDEPRTAEASPEQSQDEQQDQSQAQVSMEDSADMEQGDEAEMPEGEAPLEPPPPAPIPTPTRTIPSITTDFDEEIKAEDLAEPAELERLRAYLDQQLEPLKGAVSPPGQQAAAPPAGPAEPQLGVRPEEGIA